MKKIAPISISFFFLVTCIFQILPTNAFAQFFPFVHKFNKFNISAVFIDKPIDVTQLTGTSFFNSKTITIVDEKRHLSAKDNYHFIRFYLYFKPDSVHRETWGLLEKKIVLKNGQNETFLPLVSDHHRIGAGSYVTVQSGGEKYIDIDYSAENNELTLIFEIPNKDSFDTLTLYLEGKMIGLLRDLKK